MEEHGVSKLVSVKFSAKAGADSPETTVADTFGKSTKLASEHDVADPEHPDFLEEPASADEAPHAESPEPAGEETNPA